MVDDGAGAAQARHPVHALGSAVRCVWTRAAPIGRRLERLVAVDAPRTRTCFGRHAFRQRAFSARPRRTTPRRRRRRRRQARRLLDRHRLQLAGRRRRVAVLVWTGLHGGRSRLSKDLGRRRQLHDGRDCRHAAGELDVLDRRRGEWLDDVTWCHAYWTDVEASRSTTSPGVTRTGQTSRRVARRRHLVSRVLDRRRGEWLDDVTWCHSYWTDVEASGSTTPGATLLLDELDLLESSLLSPIGVVSSLFRVTGGCSASRRRAGTPARRARGLGTLDRDVEGGRSGVVVSCSRSEDLAPTSRSGSAVNVVGSISTDVDLRASGWPAKRAYIHAHSQYLISQLIT